MTKPEAPDLDRHPVADNPAAIEQIPVIDVAALLRDATAPAAAVAIDQIAAACKTWGEFRGRRSDGDYADYGTEVQISQYRV